MFEMFTSLTMTFSLCEEFGVHGRFLDAGRQNLRASDTLFLDYLIKKPTSGVVGLERNFTAGLLEVGVGDCEHLSSPF